MGLHKRGGVVGLFTLENSQLRLVLSDRGEIIELVNKDHGRNLVLTPQGCFWICFRDGHSMENVVMASDASPRIESRSDGLLLHYDYLMYRGTKLDVQVGVEITMVGESDEIHWKMHLTNGTRFEIVEVCFPTVRIEIEALPAKGRKVVLPFREGIYMPLPWKSEQYFKLPQVRRPYDGPDQFHQDICITYPGTASMQWFDACSDEFGVYLASYDASFQTTGLLARQEMAQWDRGTELTMGVVKYPFLDQGESWESPMQVLALHAGDWHVGADRYREWASRTWYTPLDRPDWVREFPGWLRCIFRHHNQQVLFDFQTIPSLLQSARKGNLNTVFVLGWHPGGFASDWPDYTIDPELGGEAGLRAAIDEVHRQGGRVFMFLSYYLLDPRGKFYQEVGKDITLVDLWGRETAFAETYPGESTWLRVSDRQPLLCACPSTPEWQQLMIEEGQRLASLGVDGVLYDIGGAGPVFCMNDNHPHEKPSLAFATKPQNFKELREAIQAVNPNATICMEHTVDAFGQHMGIIQGTLPPSSYSFHELIRYTFPEYVITNRNVGLDERDYRAKVNHSFMYGLRFDMSVFRCRGTLDDIPNYAAYLAQVNELTSMYKHILRHGRFRDTLGLQVDTEGVVGKVYEYEGRSAAILRNRSDRTVVVEPRLYGALCTATAKPGAPSPEAETSVTLEPDSVCIALFD